MQEVIDFLSAQPPFDVLPADDVKRLAQGITVISYAQGAEIVTAGSPPLDRMWLVRTGQVEVLDRGRVIDVLTDGDSFGHASLLSGQRPRLTVRAAEDTVCFELPDPRTMISHPEALQFANFSRLAWRESLVRPGILAAGQRPVERYMRPAVWCSPDQSIRAVAQQITSQDSSCALVRDARGVGIVTDRDFRSRVATGDLSLDDPVSTLASFPVESVGRAESVAAALVRMVEAGVHHLAVLDESDRPAGVVRAIDLGSVDVRDPLLIRSAIQSAGTVEDLAKAAALISPTIVELIDSGLPVVRVGALATAITEAILLRLLTLNQDILGGPVATSWLVLGSLARREPLPSSDVDTAIVWATPEHGPEDAEQIRGSARLVLAQLTSVGLERCPNRGERGQPSVLPLAQRLDPQRAALDHRTDRVGGAPAVVDHRRQPSDHPDPHRPGHHRHDQGHDAEPGLPRRDAALHHLPPAARGLRP